MNHPGKWLDLILFGHSIQTFLSSAAVFLVVILLGTMLRRFARERLLRLALMTDSRWDDLLVSIIADVRQWLVIALAIQLGLQGFAIPENLQRVISALVTVAVAAQVLLASRLMVDYWLDTLTSRRLREDGTPDPAIKSASGIIRFIAMVVLAALTLLLLLSNVGVEVTPLITGLGIGGIAVALAAQSILGDLFGSLTILFDRPFLVGDFIIVGDKMGTVENIGVKTTRLRALSGEQLIFANSTLLAEKIQNYQRMQERRVVQTIGVVYETPLAKMKRIPGILRESVTAAEQVRFERAHFRGFGAYSLDFEIVYHVLSADYNRYMDLQQEINLRILERFLAEEIDFAYPTQVEIRRCDNDNLIAAEES